MVYSLAHGDLRSETIAYDDLPDYLRTAATETNDAEITAERFFAALEQANQNRSRAAEILGISRAHFYRLFKKFRGEDL